MTAPRKNQTAYHEPGTCPNDECGKNFDHPIELTVLSSKPAETYRACPYCMSRLDMEEPKEQEETKPEKRTVSFVKVKAALEIEKEKEKIETKNVDEHFDEHTCTHGFGYLKKRPKGTSIPDECLVCPKMIQCLA